MTRPLWLHAAWLALATLFNAGSALAIANGQPGWAGPSVLGAQAGVGVMALVLVPGLLGWTRAYRVSAGCVGVVLLVGGVGRHLVADPAVYASALTRVAGVCINLFGVAGFALGAVRGTQVARSIEILGGR